MNQKEFDLKLNELLDGFNDLVKGFRELFTDIMLELEITKSALEESRKNIDLFTGRPNISRISPEMIVPITELSKYGGRLYDRECRRCCSPFRGPYSRKLCDKCLSEARTNSARKLKGKKRE